MAISDTRMAIFLTPELDGNMKKEKAIARESVEKSTMEFPE